VKVEPLYVIKTGDVYLRGDRNVDYSAAFDEYVAPDWTILLMEEVVKYLLAYNKIDSAPNIHIIRVGWAYRE
jgi:hypothetical protein